MRTLIRWGCMLLLLAACQLAPAQRMASTYPNLQAFLDSCPQNDPYVPIIRRDFQILRDQVAVGNIPCTEPYTQMPPSLVTDELSIIQALRFAYYMDMGRSGYLPWTPLRLYDWMKSRVAGVNIISAMQGGGACCLILNNLTYFNVGSLAGPAGGDGYAAQAQYKQTADGLAASVGLFAHEVRHTEGNGYPHVLGCPLFPTTAACDQTYDETNLSPYGIQYYLAKQMMTGAINLGYSCDAATQAALGTAFQALANAYPGRFVTNAPPQLTLPAAPGGACIPASTLAISSAPSQTISPEASFSLGITASNAQTGWTAASFVPWITPTAGANSVGSGQAVFAIGPSSSSLNQSGTVIAAGQIVSVACTSACTVAPQSFITFGALGNVPFGSAPFALNATASSGLPVTFTSATPSVCTVSGATLTIVATGTCSLTATQAGSGVYAAATPVTQIFTVTGQTPQAIAFNALPGVTLGAAPLTIAATASSGLPVTFVSTTPLICTVSGNVVTLVLVGTCSITAFQTGNAVYAPASPVVQSFAVASASAVTWTLNVTFADGGAASGVFTFDSKTKVFTNWDVWATGGDTSVFFPFEFTPANSSLFFSSTDPSGLTLDFASNALFTAPSGGLSENLYVATTLASPLSSGASTINTVSGPYSGECFNCYPYRPVIGGTVSMGLRAPSINPGGIVPAGSAFAAIQAGEWVSIYGTNLAPATLGWNGDFPTSLGGAKVTINGKPASLSFVSPGQINVEAPSDATTGTVPVVITTASGTATATVTLAQFAPSFFLLDGTHVAGIIVRQDGSGAHGGGAYDILGPTGRSLGYPTVAAKAGDIVELFATGLGPTNPAIPAGQLFSGAAPTTNPVSLVINNAKVAPSFAGLSGAGLYQINVTIPPGLGTGDVSLVASVGGAQTAKTVVISLQ
jgi:uncharacterized protein (TIGR03437 family)